MKIKLLIALTVSFLTNFASATEYLLPPAGINVVGKLQLVKAKDNETLLDIAREFKVGNNEMFKANPNVDRWYPGAGTPIVIPSRYILPDTPRQGLVLNLPEMRIYFYPKVRNGEKPTVITYPVGVGRQNWRTPLGKTKIIEKVKNPTWTPPKSILAEHLAKGDPLPRVVAAGPNNPLGSRKMRLGIPGYLIHGTNKPYGVGMRVSHGCVRLRTEDVEELFGMVSVGQTVRIINQPLKIGHFAGSLFMEFHSPLDEDNLSFEDNFQNALRLAEKKLKIHNNALSENTIKAVVQEESGFPVEVTLD